MELCLWQFFVPYASPITFSLSSFPTSCYNQIHEKPNYTNEKPNHTLMLTMNKTTSYLHTKVLCSPNQQPNNFSFQLHKTWIEIYSIRDYSTYPFLIYNYFQWWQSWLQTNPILTLYTLKWGGCWIHWCTFYLNLLKWWLV